ADRGAEPHRGQQRAPHPGAERSTDRPLALNSVPSTPRRPAMAKPPQPKPTLERRALLAGGASLGLGALACQSGPAPAAATATGAAPAGLAPSAPVVLEQLRLGP